MKQSRLIISLNLQLKYHNEALQEIFNSIIKNIDLVNKNDISELENLIGSEYIKKYFQLEMVKPLAATTKLDYELKVIKKKQAQFKDELVSFLEENIARYSSILRVKQFDCVTTRIYLMKLQCDLMKLKYKLTLNPQIKYKSERIYMQALNFVEKLPIYNPYKLDVMLSYARMIDLFFRKKEMAREFVGFLVDETKNHFSDDFGKDAKYFRDVYRFLHYYNENLNGKKLCIFDKWLKHKGPLEEMIIVDDKTLFKYKKLF